MCTERIKDIISMPPDGMQVIQYAKKCKFVFFIFGLTPREENIRCVLPCWKHQSEQQCSRPSLSQEMHLKICTDCRMAQMVPSPEWQWGISQVACFLSSYPLWTTFLSFGGITECIEQYTLSIRINIHILPKVWPPTHIHSVHCALIFKFYQYNF